MPSLPLTTSITSWRALALFIIMIVGLAEGSNNNAPAAFLRDHDGYGASTAAGQAASTDAATAYEEHVVTKSAIAHGDDNDNLLSVVDTAIDDASFPLASSAATVNSNAFDTSSMNLQRQDEKQRRRLAGPACLATNDCCMSDAYDWYRSGDIATSEVGCTSSSVKFLAITGFDVYDPNAEECNCDASDSAVECTSLGADAVTCERVTKADGTTSKLPIGTQIGACLGADDNVNVSFTVNVEVGSTQYDIGMYINTDGGSATGVGASCVTRTGTPGTYGGILVEASAGDKKNADPQADTCVDFANSGTLTDYPFQPMILTCQDTTGSSGSGDSDGLLDFDVGIGWSNGAGYDCHPTGEDATIDGKTYELKPPYPSQTSKCWHGDVNTNSRFTLNIYVPPYDTPSAKPSTSFTPSETPSISLEPSQFPSETPSISIFPSESPSLKPSTSAEPSTVPSEKPSISTEPSLMPSESPSISSKPSLMPSESPSISSKPTDQPSNKPSISIMPSDQPSYKPSISIMPSEYPSVVPTSKPSPSPSFSPTSKPSLSPSISMQPTTSVAPSSGTRWPSSIPTTVPSASPTAFPTGIPSSSPTGVPSSSPTAFPTGVPSFEPSISQAPTAAPTGVPSVSKEPSVEPTYAPSDSPSEPPTGGLYYPDWVNEEQICVNDGADPEYMKQIQRDNYLYRSKEECCQEHFWWRIAQCMQNEHSLYYSNGEYCEQKTTLDQWEVKYSPQVWDSSDLFETLEECCNAKHWWAVPECMAASPKEIVFDFTFDLKGLIEPQICQDADTIANALGVAMDTGIGVEGAANVTSIGCVTLTRNPDTSNPECGGCLAGSSFSGNWDGTREEGYYDVDPNQATTISVEISKSCDAGVCSDAASLEAFYQQVRADFESFFMSGLEAEIHRWSQERAPPVPELWAVEVDTGSYYNDGTFTNPLENPEDTREVTVVTTTGELSVPNLDTPVEVVEVTTMGSFSVSNMDTSTLDSTQIEELSSYFEDAIASSIGASLPEGSIITITSIDNGVVQYEITTYAESSTEASTAISQIETSLGDSATLSSITNSVQSAVQASTDPDLASDVGTSISVDSNTPGATSTPTTTSKVTVNGELTVSGLNPSSFSTAQEEEAKDFFESALTQQLEAEGLLPEGATVVVTGLSDDGTVQYEVNFYGTTSEESSAAISSIESSLSQASTLSSISATVQAESSSSSTGISSSLSSVSITDSTQVGTAGLTMTAAEEAEAKDYFEDAIVQSLGTDLPDGATVKVTGIENGVVKYEITMEAGSADEASAAVASINTSLSDTTTLSAITASVASASETTTVTTSGELTVPNLNQEVEVFGVTTEGSFSLTNFDPSSFDASQTDEVIEFFEDAITAELEALGLPAGSSVTVTSISNGVVEYEVFTFADSSTDASTAATDIEATLNSATSSITNSVVAASQASSDTTISNAMASTSVNSNSISATSTPTNVSQVTVEGELAVSGLNPSSFSTAEEEEAKDIFESALTQQLEAGGLLPEGATVVVTGLSDDGKVQYEIHFFGDNTSASSTAISNIESSLSQTSTLSSISATVQTESSTSSISSSLSSVGITGNTQVSTTGLTMTAAEEEVAKDYFEDAIAQSLGTDLPDGAIVTVTGIEDGKVAYIITMDVESSAAGTAAVYSINTSLAETSTLTAITTAVTSSASSTSSNPTIANALSGVSVSSNAPGSTTETSSTMNSLSGVTVASNTAGTVSEPITMAKVTSEGQLTTNLSGLTDAEVTEASEYFEKAIAATLEAEGALPEGSTVTVTGIDANGVVSYKINMYLPSGADNAVVVTDINSKLSSTSTMLAISSAVASEASSSSSAIAALSSLDVTGFVEGESVGVSFKKWYPSWVSPGSYCANDGNQPPFMREVDNQADYLFDTQKECCDMWYSYADDCVGSSGNPNAPKFYPKYTSGECERKEAKDFEDYEQDRYDSLQDCCRSWFSNDMQKCCDSPGMGGCAKPGEEDRIVYLPDWTNNTCLARGEATLASHEEEYARDSASECCGEYFSWYGNACIDASSQT